jgi:hypothetical protein
MSDPRDFVERHPTLSETVSKLVKKQAAEIEQLRAQVERAREALQFVIDGYPRLDVNHQDYRVKVYAVALDAMSELSSTNKTSSEPWSMEKALTDEEAKRVNAILSPQENP